MLAAVLKFLEGLLGQALTRAVELIFAKITGPKVSEVINVPTTLPRFEVRPGRSTDDDLLAAGRASGLRDK